MSVPVRKEGWSYTCMCVLVCVKARGHLGVIFRNTVHLLETRTLIGLKLVN